MIYNLAEYLMIQFPAETIYTNERRPIVPATTVPDRCLLLRETGGPEGPWYPYTEKSGQILARDKSTPDARDLIWDIYEYIQGIFGQILPAVTVGGVVYPAIQTAQLSFIQQPFCLGDDGEGRTEFTANFKIIYVRS